MLNEDELHLVDCLLIVFSICLHVQPLLRDFTTFVTWLRTVISGNDYVS